jgi:hypothetical protein
MIPALIKKNKSAPARLASKESLHKVRLKPAECDGVDPSSGALVDLWRERVKHALSRYQEKAVISHALATEYRRLLPKADRVTGSAFRRTLSLENDARRRYMQVLRVYMDLVMRGIAPPEEDSEIRTQTAATKAA